MGQHCSMAGVVGDLVESQSELNRLIVHPQRNPGGIVANIGGHSRLRQCCAGGKTVVLDTGVSRHGGV